MPNLTRVSMTIGGLSLLIGSEDKSVGHIAMINPSRDHMLVSDREFSNKHLPILVFRQKDIFEIEGQATPFKLKGSILPEFLSANVDSFDGFVGYSVQGSVITVISLNEKEDRRPLRFTEGEIDHLLGSKGCRRITGDDRVDNDWRSLEWTASINTLFPGLRLAPEWIESPHVGARLKLGSGTVSGTRPVVTQSGNLKVRFYGTKGPRVFTDAFLYEVDLAQPAVLVDGPENRWRVTLKQPQTAIRIWLLSLDDKFSAPKNKLTDHFFLYSLLPWRFRVPSYDFCGAAQTAGGCINLRFIKVPPRDESGTPKSADTDTIAVKAVRAKKSKDAKQRPARKRAPRSS
jgi:hypothetical protein